MTKLCVNVLMLLGAAWTCGAGIHEPADDGRCRWTLYLNNANTYEKAEGRVWHNRRTSHKVAMLEPQDVAPKHAFYRVVRTRGSSQILVMESDGECLHSHAYTHLLSEEDRTIRPSQDRYRLKEGQMRFEE